MKGRLSMPTYRSNVMPYNHNYRQTPSCLMPRESWDNKPLAMAYVPWQSWRDICAAEKALHVGTIFQELNLPFVGKGGARR